jgi:hypothetical protein
MTPRTPRRHGGGTGSRFASEARRARWRARPSRVAEPVAVLVALQLAHEFRAACSQVGDDSVDVFDGECDMTDARCVRRRVPVVVLVQGRVELRQLESSMAVRGLHDRDFCPDAIEPHDAIHPPALDRPLALQLESELDEELSRGRVSTTMPTWSIRWMVTCPMVRTRRSSPATRARKDQATSSCRRPLIRHRRSASRSVSDRMINLRRES